MEPVIHTSDTFRPLLKQLVLSIPIPQVSPTPTKPLPVPLSQEDLRSLFEHLSDPAFSGDTANHAQIGSILTAMRLGGIDIQSETLSLAAEIFVGKSRQVTLLDEAEEEVQSQRRRAEVTERIQREGWEGLQLDYQGTLDLVGTGGDGQDTFNVSTTAAIVASGVPGVRVSKHGAKASSSTSGSADLLLSLGIPLLSLTPPIISNLIPTQSFTFLFAQLFHTALAPLGPIRRALGHPTIFNVLGPLINPAKPKRCILGVHSSYLGGIFIEALKKQGCEMAWVVCGKEGLDEISIEGETDVWQLDTSGTISHFTVSPSTFGIDAHSLTTVASHTSQENAAIVLHITQPGIEASIKPSSPPLTEDLKLKSSINSTTSTQEATSHLMQSLPPIPKGTDLRAILDYTLLQTAALLYVGGYVSSYKHATSLARHSLNSGAALRSLENFREGAIREVEKEAGKK